jgi:hypothetical protein
MPGTGRRLTINAITSFWIDGTCLRGHRCRLCILGHADLRVWRSIHQRVRVSVILPRIDFDPAFSIPPLAAGLLSLTTRLSFYCDSRTNCWSDQVHP